MQRAQNLLFLLVTYVFQDTCYGNLKNDGKIVGGYHTTIKEHPEQVFLLVQSKDILSRCGGSILDEVTILTAAHCLRGAYMVFAKVGVTNSQSNNTLFISSEKLLLHPNYNNKTSDFDVGIVKLRVNMTLDGIKTKAIQLVECGSENLIGSEITVSGWGTTTEQGMPSDNLKSVKIKIISNEVCKKTYPELTDRMICAGTKEGGEDSCQGDSGGPAVLTNSGKQVGIVSFGKGCGRFKTPGVYTNIANKLIRSWIDDNLGN